MKRRTIGDIRGVHGIRRGLVLLGGLGLLSAVQAGATVLVEPGQRALLKVSVDVEGSVKAPQGKRGEVVEWSTQRHFTASIPMEAEDQASTSFSAAVGSDAAARAQDYQELARQAEACGQDQACLMQLAVKMSDSSAAEQAGKGAPRYQLWRAVREGDAEVDAKASYQDTWHTLFYSAAAEITDCTLTAPVVSPELTRVDAALQTLWDEKNRETQLASARAFALETDAQMQSSQLHVPALGVGSGDEKCIRTLGGPPKTAHRASNGAVLPVGELAVPLRLAGSAPGTIVIASGAAQIDTRLVLEQLGVGYAVDATVPLKVTVRWELTKQ